jgi:hypothetical protein
MLTQAAEALHSSTPAIDPLLQIRLDKRVATRLGKVQEVIKSERDRQSDMGREWRSMMEMKRAIHTM